jgi:hypothetical protein
MSLNCDPASLFATALIENLGAKYFYSRKRGVRFNAWQEHLRRSAGSFGRTPASPRDRDLRRAVVPG